MSHPSISAELIRDRLNDLITGKVSDLSDLAGQAGDGAPVDTSLLDATIAEIKLALADRERGSDPPPLDDDQFEGEMAGKLHAVLKDRAISLLDDPGFWGYLASGPLWFLTRWREDPASRNLETYHVYVDGTKNDMCVPLRMFLRAQAIEQNGDYSLASAIPAGTDFWRSHILRVKSGTKRELARGIAEEQLSNRMTVSRLRQYARRINRRWTNEVIHGLGEGDCRGIAREERPS